MDASASHRSGELPLPAKISPEPSTELDQMSRASVAVHLRRCLISFQFEILHGTQSPLVYVIESTSELCDAWFREGGVGVELALIRDLPERATTTMEWTDEKHSLYLESMEASFVNQLYDSMDLLGWRPQSDNLKENSKSKHLLKSRCSPSGQFKVLREGCWKKLNFEKPDFHQSRAEDSFGFVTSPWIQHFRHPKVEEAESPSKNHKQQRRTNLDGDTATFPSPPTKLRQPPNNWLCREVVFGSNAEVSDQNFVDEDAAEQTEQTTTNAAEQNTNSWSSSDQVVPYRDPSRRRGSSSK